ncbi:hypothetical protein E4U54_007240 [Claviceps lovelessii]|nr:hypothetical protein E4U54_007240 [Claviceps lovelessii]
MSSTSNSGERRRRQNRESQQRRSIISQNTRKHQKWPSGVVVDHGSGDQTGQALAAARQDMMMHMAATMNLPPNQHPPENSKRSQALIGCYDEQDSFSQIPPSPRHPQQQQPPPHHQAENGHCADIQALWTMMGLNFSAAKGPEWQLQCKRFSCDRILEPTSTISPPMTLCTADDMTPSPASHYQSPVSMVRHPSIFSTGSQHETLGSESYPRRYLQMKNEQSTMGFNRSRGYKNVLPSSRSDRSLVDHTDVHQEESPKYRADKLKKEVQDLYKLGVKVGFLG